MNFYKNNFDLIRLFAALQVMLLHSFGYLKLNNIPEIITNILSNFPGVPIFFIISGFLISASYERVKNVNEYIKNRFLRIYPGLWISIIIAIISMYIFYEKEVGFNNVVKWIIARATILQFYHNDVFNNYGMGNLNGALWTISIELQFYILLPLLYLLFKNNLNKYLFIFLFISFSINLFYLSILNKNFFTKLLGVSVFPYLYMFLLGVLIQRYFNKISYILVNKAFYWLLFYLSATWFLKISGFIEKKYIFSIAVFILALFIISFAYTSTNLSKILNNNDISYGIYIYHLIITNILIQINFIGNLKSLFLLISITIVVAFISWKTVEKPCLSLKKKALFKRT